MKTLRLFTPLFLFTVLASPAIGQVEVLSETSFDTPGDRGVWVGANHLKDITVSDGVLRASASGGDPFLVAEKLDFPANISQAVEFRYRTNRPGKGDLFFTGTTEGPYGGFSEQKRVSWDTLGDGEWHTTRIFPSWQNEKRIITLRIDFPNLAADDVDGAFYELDGIRIVDMHFETAPEVGNASWFFGLVQDSAKHQDAPSVFAANGDGPSWKQAVGDRMGMQIENAKISGAIELGPVSLDADKFGSWLSVYTCPKGVRKMTFSFVSGHGSDSLDIPVNFYDGEIRWHNIDLSQSPAWKGKVHFLRLAIQCEGVDGALVRSIEISDKPRGRPYLTVERIFQPDAINRVGKPSPIAIRLKNHGGGTSKVKLGNIWGVTLVDPMKAYQQIMIPPMETGTIQFDVEASRPMKDSDDEVGLMLKGDSNLGDATVFSLLGLRYDEKLDLPKADYVPEPVPVESDYDIGAFYFPGWAKRESWDRVERTHPERRPALGWYDEANPEVIDWQIKWSLENGIRYYFVDWYWDRGRQQLDHWVKGFQKARYKSMFRWAVMWANHNAPGSHSEEDQRAVTKFWIENYFNTPEYRTVDGRPAVVIWSPENMDRDIAEIERKKGNTLKKGEGVKRLLDISQAMAKEAGFKGIYFIAMKWPEASTHPDSIQWLADAGFEMTSIYHYMDHGGKAKNPMRFDFELVVRASLPYWEARHKAGVLPFLPNLSTGWDSRPWHGEKQIIIENRTVEHFRTICRDFKTFAERTGLKSFVLAPTNEWGEGSYIEPNAEYGFGMFEVLRETFCKEPAGGWPVNFVPADVGLGPYDLPRVE